jgi:hypothetical protein
MTKHSTYTIYSHFNADGGIAASLLLRLLRSQYSHHGWKMSVKPVRHHSQNWHLQQLHWPCAIVNLSLHPSFLNEKFFPQVQRSFTHSPPCYWINHHLTDSHFSFLNEQNCHHFLKNILAKWDTSAFSTPGLLRVHHQELGFPKELIDDYQEFIDLAEIIDGALYANCLAAYDFSAPAVKLQTLFQATHPLVDPVALYQKAVYFISKNPCVEDFFDSDAIYSGILNYEEQAFFKKLHAYERVTRLQGLVACAHFAHNKEFKGFGRFLPSLFFESQALYCLHILPKNLTTGQIFLSCGQNPWKKNLSPPKHLGKYFAQHFSGGGSAFVAEGQCHESQFYKIKKFVEYLNEQ